MTTITTLDTALLPIAQLVRHPHNRPLGLNREKIEQLKASIERYGFYSNQPLVVRPLNGHYQIIKGEHRYTAAQELGFTELPCSIQEMDDTEALVQLIIGNIQTENKPLEIGLNALEFVAKYERGGSAKDYAERTGVNYNSLSVYLQAAKVYEYIKNVVSGYNILDEPLKLAEIGRCNQSDWTWLHAFIIEHDLSKNDVIAVCRAVRALDDAITVPAVAAFFKLTELKQRIARETLSSDKTSKTLTNTKALIEAMQSNHDGLDACVTFYTYHVSTDSITEEQVNLRTRFLDRLGTHKQMTPATINSVALALLDEKQQHTQEAAERTAAYYREERNETERRERQRIEQARDTAIIASWLACESEDAIARAARCDGATVRATIERYRTSSFQPRAATFTELVTNKQGEEVPGFEAPIFNIWTFAKKTNEVAHFGNSEQRIVENLLYLYTEPYDIVLDPFAGGGATIDVCRKRYRRYYVSDRKPIEARDDEIRAHDLTDGLPPLGDLWSDVTLTYLDPPYWRQAANQYSTDPTDLANMPLDQFTDTMSRIVKDISQRQSRGVIALIIQPTQWSADNRRFTDHVTDLIRAVGNKRLVLENRVSCPYSTEQYNAQQVDWAKAHKKLLVITRELIIWRIAE